MRSISALDTQLINLKRSGKEDVTHKPAIEGEHHKQFRARAVCSSVFFPTPALKKSLVPYCFFLLLKRQWRTETAQSQQLCMTSQCSYHQNFISLCQNSSNRWIFCLIFSDPSQTIADSKSFPVTMVIVICVASLVVIAIVIGLLVMIRLSQSSRGPAVKDISADLARDNLGFNELEVKTLSVKSREKPISSWTEALNP